MSLLDWEISIQKKKRAETRRGLQIIEPIRQKAGYMAVHVKRSRA
jgi:hypothetical protein